MNLQSFMFRLIAAIVWILISSIPARSTLSDNISSNLVDSAFCMSKESYHGRYFPIDVPERHMPWIWEAVYDPVAEYLDISTINRYPCSFDKNSWKYLSSIYAEHGHQLGYGLDSNILVPTDANTTKAQMFYLLGDFVYCDFLDKDGRLVHRIPSRMIYGKRAFVMIGTLQIRCPISNNIVWDRFRLELNPKRRAYHTGIFSDKTIAVPACKLPEYNRRRKQYRLSICSATNRANRSHLVEWIEYHRMLGVEHFFLYNTAVDDIDLLPNTLVDYVNEGLVSIIPWPFMNCVRNMAGGRWSSYEYNGESLSFKSPRAISQHAALASCYSRFRHTSTYMTHIDEDEFLVFSSELVANTYHLSRPPRDLFELAESVFQRHPSDVAIRFEPVIFAPCNRSNHKQLEYYNAIASADTSTVFHIEQQYISTPLPRLGVWDASYRYEPFECKLLWRTDVVAMFFVHFITMIEDRRFKDISMTLPLSHIALLHYKYPASLAKNILESELPLKVNAFQEECSKIPPQFKIYHAQVPLALAEGLKARYRKRMVGTSI